MKWSRWNLFYPIAAGLCLAALSASGATFNIANGDVAALISAINTSSSNAQNDTINLASNGTYTFTAADQSATSDGPADGITALPQIGRDGVAPNPFHTLILNGNNATLIRATGAPAFRLLKVFNTGAGASVTINNLTLANGYVTGTNGDGGGIRTAGTVTLNNCYVRDSVGVKGGGISNQNGALILNNCTIASCSASQGGGLYNGNPANYNAAMTVTSCTFYNNHATDGGNIFNDGPRSGDFGTDMGTTTMNLISCTLREGSVRNDGNDAQTKLTFKNSIFSNSPVSNYVSGSYGGTVTSLGFNLSTATAQGYFTAVTDRWNAEPKLDTAGLKMNGGPTPTFALCAGSEAIDHGNRYNLITDQRGFTRPVDNPAVANTVDGTDIGAFEAPADPIQCSPYTVTTFADHNDGLCSGNDCTLREAIAQTNSLTYSTGETRTITFAPSITGRMGLTGGELIVTKSATIVGPGARLLEISGNAQSRVFSLSSNSTYVISGLTIRDGYVSGTTGASVEGGGIYNAGTLALSDCTLVHNLAIGGGGLSNTSNPGGTARGGAIFNSGYLTVTRCTIGGADSNTSNGVFGGKGGDHPTDADILYHGGTGGAALGGAIYNDTIGGIFLENTTIAGNTATGGNGGAAYFGGAGGAAVAGIYNLYTMYLTASTVSANSAVGGAAGHSDAGTGSAAGTANGGVYAERSMTSTVSNTIIAGNTRNPGGAMDVSGSFTSDGFNLIGITNGQSGFTGPSDQVGTFAAPLNPVLGPLQNNGGPTNTMALLTGSPALDKGSAALATDQRSQPRPKDNPGTPNAAGGNGSDIGAFEADTNVPGPSPTPTATATPNPTATPIPTATPTATPSSTPGHLLNIATRLRVQTGDNVLIGGFIITGSDPKRLVIRGIGPSLAQFFSDPLPDPTLELYQGDTLLATNNDWKDSQTEIEATGLQPSNDLESAIVRTLNPGNYTAIVRGNGNSTGIGVVEAYDLSPSANSKLANIATRGFVDTGDNVMIGGFITGGDAQIVIRAIGPSLGNFGVSGALPDPTLELVNSNGGIVRSNDNWRESQPNEIAATGLQPGDDRESALIESLSAGNYTAVVRGVGNSTGIGLVEIYDFH